MSRLEPTAWTDRRVVVLAGGEAEGTPFLRDLVQPDDAIVAADGGARMALAAGLRLDLVVGDLDSLAPADLEAVGDETPVVRHPVDKDASDLELALDIVLDAHPREVLVLGALGGRADHFLINVGLLHRARAAGIPMRLVGEGVEMRLVEGEVSLEAAVGSIVSLVPVSPRVEGIWLEGFRYPLCGETLSWGTSRGLSNVVVKNPSRLSVRDGLVLVVVLAALGQGPAPTAP